MILVTGTGRCGSSLMMQTLYYLGVPLVGDPKVDNDEHLFWGAYNIVNRENTDVKVKASPELDKKARSFNPKGYWELDMLTIIDHCRKGFGEQNIGHVIKITGALVTELQTNDIEKMIICKREDTVKQAESMMDLAKIDIQIAEENNLKSPNFTEWYKDKTYLDVMTMQTTQGIMLDSLAMNYDIPSIPVYFEDMLKNPEKEIKELVQFLELGDVDISEAINNVDKR